MIFFQTSIWKSQTEDYYPFGLTFNQQTREGTQDQNYLYNGIERQTDLDLNWDLADFRSYDSSIGRWHQLDPKGSERESLYVGFANNPILYSDPLGDTIRVVGSDEFKAQYAVDRAIIAKTKVGAKLLKTLDESKKETTITEAFSLYGSLLNLFSEGSGDKSIVQESDTQGNGPDEVNGDEGVSIEVSQIDGVENSSTELLVHELQHASDIIDGTLNKKRKELGKTDSGGKKLKDFAETRALQTTKNNKEVFGKK